ncbi:MAG TPA: cobalt ECF transporter T component CbiQ [Polyangiaceae bacterium]|nr:cobalt ECF transporter T component CbiQ [Polyangiaceae bacterium]
MSRAHWLRSYANLDSPIHRASASLKLLAALALVTAIAFVPVERAYWTVLVLVAILLGARAAGVPLRAFLTRLAIAQPFVLSVALLALFQRRGLDVCGAIVLKSTACVAAVQLLAHTTPFPDLLRVMARVRVPRALVTTLALLHRYLYILVDETRRMRQARAARTWSVDRRTAWRSLASVIAVSFVRSSARADRVEAAMRARGWS